MKKRKRLSSIVNRLEKQIYNGTYKKGEYLPGIRPLSSDLGCSTVTAHRAVKKLADKGLVITEPCHGNRVVENNPASAGSTVVAFLDDTVRSAEYLGGVYNTQTSILQQEAAEHNLFTVILPYKGQAGDRIEDQLNDMNASVLVVQNVSSALPQDLLVFLAGLDMPVISLDAPYHIPGIDHVCRNEIEGAVLAAEYLAEKGYRNIGWYGSLRSSFGIRRFSGAAGVLLSRGLMDTVSGWSHTETPEQIETAREYLSQPDRPQAVLALWQEAALALIRAARESGMTLGTDIEITGWILEEHLKTGVPHAVIEEGLTSPFATWSMKNVSRLLINRIRERFADPGLPDACIYSPMKLETSAPVVSLGRR